MANKILTEDDYESRIRDVLGVDAAYLPNEVINQSDFLTVGELNIIDLVPDYEDKTGNDKIRLVAATICEVARLICPTIPVRLPRIQQGPHGKHDLQYIDWTKKATELMGKRDVLLSKLKPFTGYSFGFRLTNPYRLKQ